MINLTAHLNLIKFGEIANGLPREDAECVATAFPDMFKDAIEFGPAKEPTPKGEPAGPRVAKVRPSTPEPAIDKDAAWSAILTFVRAHPRERGEDIATKCCPVGVDPQKFARATRAMLENAVTAGTMYADGAKRGRRYWLAPPKADPQEAAE